MAQKGSFAVFNAKVDQCTGFGGVHIHACNVCDVWMTESNTPGRIILFKCGHIVHAHCFEASGKFCKKCNKPCTNFTLCHMKTLHGKEHITAGAARKKSTALTIKQ